MQEPKCYWPKMSTTWSVDPTSPVQILMLVRLGLISWLEPNLFMKLIEQSPSNITILLQRHFSNIWYFFFFLPKAISIIRTQNFSCHLQIINLCSIKNDVKKLIMLIIILQLSTLYLLKFWWGNETNDSCICHQTPRATTIFLHERLNIIKRDLAKKGPHSILPLKKIKAKEMMIKIWALEPTCPTLS